MKIKFLLYVLFISFAINSVAQTITKNESNGTWAVVMGSYKTEKEASVLIDKCKSSNVKVELLQTNNFEKLTKDYFFVCAGKQLEKEKAQKTASEIKAKGFAVFAKDAGAFKSTENGPSNITTDDSKENAVINIGDTKVLELIFKESQDGDMATYYNFIDSKTKEEITFSYMDWKNYPKEDFGCVNNPPVNCPQKDVKYIVTMIYELSTVYEYKGQDEGTVALKKKEKKWMITKITKKN